MLVLSRKPSQQFQIGEDIRVTVVRVDRNVVRIGIEAPDGTPIYRQEILEPAGVGASESDADRPWARFV